MHARGDAGQGRTLSELREPDDPRLLGLSRLLNRTFPDPNSVLGLDRMQEFLAANHAGASRLFCVLVADEAGAVVGGSVFSYVPRSNCGFSEYLVVERNSRGRGLGRRLFDERKRILDARAAEHAHAVCRGLFIEVDSPDRTPPELLEEERETSIDPYTRLRIFGHMGFRRVDVPYVQPPLADDKAPVDYLDLLFAPWEAEAPRDTLPTEWVFQTVEAIWSAWTPQFADYMTQLREKVRTPEVPLHRLDAK